MQPNFVLGHETWYKVAGYLNPFSVLLYRKTLIHIYQLIISILYTKKTENMFSLEGQEKMIFLSLRSERAKSGDFSVRQIKRKNRKIHVFHSPVRQFSVLNTTLV